MKAVMLMFDSLNRHFLPPYGCEWVHAPNFQRLAQRAAAFNRSYVCSMPCMPARRDLHTARPNFLHRSWSPLEAFDDSAIAMLSKAGVYTHLASDHYHYWEDGGATYHGRYDSWECFRGQEGDTFLGQVAEPIIPEHMNGKSRRSDWVNRMHIKEESEYPQAQTVKAGIEFMRRNHQQDRWFLQIECFDPHEPFTSPRKYKDRYAEHYDEYEGPLFDWPAYRPVKDETPEQIEHVRHEYASLVSMCDAHLGDVMDAMDALDLWKDTMLVVWTDHGHFLGERGLFAKNYPPMYNELANTPLFVWDPRHPQAAGQRREALVQPAIDLPVTLLGYFGVEPTGDMLGRDMAPTVARDKLIREAGIFGYFGQAVNVTDGRYVYMRYPTHDREGLLNQYTLTLCNMRGWMGGGKTPLTYELAGPLAFTKGLRVLKIPAGKSGGDRPVHAGEHYLFDLRTDPGQQQPIHDPIAEKMMIEHLLRLMRQADAPAEQYQRLGLPAPNPAAAAAR